MMMKSRKSSEEKEFEICGICGGTELRAIGFEDESPTICDSCHTTEPEIAYVNKAEFERRLNKG